MQLNKIKDFSCMCDKNRIQILVLTSIVKPALRTCFIHLFIFYCHGLSIDFYCFYTELILMYTPHP